MILIRFSEEFCQPCIGKQTPPDIVRWEVKLEDAGEDEFLQIASDLDGKDVYSDFSFNDTRFYVDLPGFFHVVVWLNPNMNGTPPPIINREGIPTLEDLRKK